MFVYSYNTVYNVIKLDIIGPYCDARSAILYHMFLVYSMSREKNTRLTDSVHFAGKHIFGKKEIVLNIKNVSTKNIRTYLQGCDSGSSQREWYSESSPTTSQVVLHLWSMTKYKPSMFRSLRTTSYRQFASVTKLYPVSPFESYKGIMSSIELEIIRPDDFHHHLRDGDVLEEIVRHAARSFGRILAMPNIKPPVRNLEEVISALTCLYSLLLGSSRLLF